jgi:hypothetical protein
VTAATLFAETLQIRFGRRFQANAVIDVAQSSVTSNNRLASLPSRDAPHTTVAQRR